jgi:hypothetical protein
MAEKTETKIGISLSDIKTSPRVAAASKESTADIVAYRHDMYRSLLIGGLAIAAEIVIYFSGVLR